MICERMLSVEEILEPFQKRRRLDALLACPEDSASEQDAIGALACSAAEKRVHSLLVDALQEHQDKRLRLGPLPSAADTEETGGFPSSNSSGCSGDPGLREAAIRGWAENIACALQGCPSTEEAAQRCVRALVEFEAEVRQSTLREAELSQDARGRGASVDEDMQATPSEEMQHKNRVLMRAVNHLAERCRRLEQENSEKAALETALEQAQEVQRRLHHANQVLQGHLKIHLDAVACKA